MTPTQSNLQHEHTFSETVGLECWIS